jgi:general secretion pathway protein E/type IV pilus assembly protein PilB
VQHNEEYVLKALEEGGLITRPQIDGARSLLNGEPGVVDVLINDGVVSDVDVSRTLAAQAHMDWIDISSMVIPPQIINQIRGEDARRFRVIPVAFGETGWWWRLAIHSTSTRSIASVFSCNASWNWYAPVPRKFATH